MYSAVLLVHSWLRWAVLLAGVLAVARGLTGRFGRRPWTPADDTVGRWLMITLDLQLTIGLILYFALSPFTRDALHDFRFAMQNAALRFWAVEHAFGMLIGVILAHVGRARIRRSSDDARRHRLALIFYTLALIAIVVSIPWPGTPNGRPLLRW